MYLLFFCFLFFLTSCATKGYLKVENQEKVLKITEYDKKMKVKEIPGQPQPPESEAQESEPLPKEITKIEKVKPSKKIKKTEKKAGKLNVKQPSLEDAEAFVGRRPIVDPFRVNEKIVLKLSYFNVVAGELTMQVLPFVEVNGSKSYHFVMSIKSNALFSKFYSVDDSAETFLDYNDMIPYNMAVHVQETKQLRELRVFFDWKKMIANFWEKKATEAGVEEKRKTWAIPKYSQNVISASYYLRTFSLRPGKEIKFRIADEQKNMIVTAKVLRREKITTEIGELDTLVVQPEIAIEGVFQPMGEVLFWITDDERKFIVQIESKIKIGKIIAKLKELQR